MAEAKTATVPAHAEAKQPAESSLKEADKTSGPDIFDAEHEDPPLRSGSPQTPLVGALAVGAGQHMPMTDPHFGADGRWYADVQDARAASHGFLSEDELDERYGKARKS